MKKVNTLISLILLIWGVIGSAGAALVTFDDLIAGEISTGFNTSVNSTNNVVTAAKEVFGMPIYVLEDYIGSEFLGTASFYNFESITVYDRLFPNNIEGTSIAPDNNSVSESATMFLLGTGLICLAGASKKTILKK